MKKYLLHRGKNTWNSIFVVLIISLPIDAKIVITNFLLTWLAFKSKPWDGRSVFCLRFRKFVIQDMWAIFRRDATHWVYLRNMNRLIVIYMHLLCGEELAFSFLLHFCYGTVRRISQLNTRKFKRSKRILSETESFQIMCYILPTGNYFAFFSMRVNQDTQTIPWLC